MGSDRPPYNDGMKDRFTARQALLACAPTLVLALWTLWSGTFWGGASGQQALVGHFCLCVLAALAMGSGLDPLGLGRRGRWLPLCLALWCLMSLLASPVPRAGRVGALLVPVFLWIPAAVARCWRAPRAHRLGVASLCGLVGAVAVVGLVEQARGFSERAALPLGHHNLLAVWLLLLGPLAGAVWAWGGHWRWLGGSSGLLALGALVQTRSLAAAFALVAVVLFLLRPRSLRRALWLLVPLVILATRARRLVEVFGGGDGSWRARLSYWQGGWQAWLERPWTGWGPGSTPWTLAPYLPPDPGLRPPGQIVADLHSLPLTLLYELGLPGAFLSLGIAVWFVSRRSAEGAVDPPLRRAAMAGLVGAAVASLAGAPLSVGALPLAAAMVSGAALAATRTPAVEVLVEVPADSGAVRWVPVAGALGIFGLLLSADLAHLAYDRARQAEDPRVRQEELGRALALDPEFPLYRARLAWVDGDEAEAFVAAHGAPGLAALWLGAGELATTLRDSREAYVAACTGDPLGALAPFHLALRELDGAMPPHDPRIVERMARALLAEPRLLASPRFEEYPDALDRALARIDGLAGVDPGWRGALLETAAEIRDLRGEVRRLVLGMDEAPETSLSLYAFRRRPWPVDLVVVELDLEKARRIDLPAATVLDTTSGRIFEDPACGLDGI